MYIFRTRSMDKVNCKVRKAYPMRTTWSKLLFMVHLAATMELAEFGKVLAYLRVVLDQRVGGVLSGEFLVESVG